MRSGLAASAVVLLLLVVDRNARAADHYLVKDLGTLGGPRSSATAVNDSGQVAGDSFTANGAKAGFLYSGGMMTDLGTLGGDPASTFTVANGINAAGQVVGSSADAGNVQRAFLYSGGAMTDLGNLGAGSSFSTASAINDAGQVAGWSTISIGNVGVGQTHAFLYSGGGMTDLGTLGGYASYATAMNAGGQVVGYSAISPSTDGSAPYHGFLYSNGTMADLGTLGGEDSFAIGINSAGQIVGNAIATTGGSSTTTASYHHAFLYSNDVMTDLGSTLGGNESYATAINASGQIVGYAAINAVTSGSPTFHAFLYDGGTMTDLNTLTFPGSGWTVDWVGGINDKGWIVGQGADAFGDLHAVLLTPALPGDANLDGTVDINDLTIVLSSFGQAGASWAQGDFNGDGQVDINDLTIVLSNYGQSVGKSVAIALVPEPGALALLSAGLVGLLAYAWRKRQ